MKNKSIAADTVRVVQIGSDNAPATTSVIRKIEELSEAGNKIPRRVTFPCAINGKVENIDYSIKEYQVDCSPKPGVLLIRVGSINRPAQIEDIKDVEISLEMCDDDDLTFVTHHNFEAEWISLFEEPDCPYIITTHKTGRNY